MRYVLTLEAIADSHTQALRAYKQSGSEIFGVREMNLMRFGRRGLAPWVAAVSLDGELLRRQAIAGSKDYSGASGSGNRGIVFYYALRPGIYEVNERVSWTKARRYFLRVTDDAAAEELTRDEVISCLR